MALIEWLNPSTSWKGATRASLRKSALVFGAWWFASVSYLAIVGGLAFRKGDLAAASAPLLLSLVVALVVAIVAFVWALGRLLASWVVE